MIQDGVFRGHNKNGYYTNKRMYITLEFLAFDKLTVSKHFFPYYLNDLCSDEKS